MNKVVYYYISALSVNSIYRFMITIISSHIKIGLQLELSIVIFKHNITSTYRNYLYNIKQILDGI